MGGVCVGGGGGGAETFVDSSCVWACYCRCCWLLLVDPLWWWNLVPLHPMPPHPISNARVAHQRPLAKARKAVDAAWEALLEAETLAKKKTTEVSNTQREFDEVCAGCAGLIYQLLQTMAVL